MERAAVVRRAWDAYAAGDLEGALQYFSPDAVWHTASDFPGTTSYRGHDGIRLLALETLTEFSLYRMTVTDVCDMGAFVMAHGVIYAERDGEPVIDRVTIWRCHVDGDTIRQVEAELVPGETGTAPLPWGAAPTPS